MKNEIKQLSLVERWELDIEAYKKGAKVLVSTPQCKQCRYKFKSNALHCGNYQEKTKPKYVMFPSKECPKFNADAPMEIEIKNQKDEKLFGGIFGLCVGDALGVPVEFISRDVRKKDPVQEMRAYGTYHQHFGTWSDDTSLTLCLMDSLIHECTLEKVVENFIGFYTKAKFTPHGEVFDIGISTKNAIEKMIRGVIPLKCGGSDESENGNGSLMRILPLVFYVKDMSLEKQKGIIEKISSLTHAHKRSKLACIIYVAFAIELLNGVKKQEAYVKAIQSIKQYHLEEYEQELIYFERITNKKLETLKESDISSSGYVVHTLEAALWTFLTTNSYSDAILRAINLGEDTDTVAAISGGLAGIYYGVSSIPDNWLQCLARKEEIYEMIMAFNETLENGKNETTI